MMFSLAKKTVTIPLAAVYGFCHWCQRGLAGANVACGCAESVAGMARAAADPNRYVCKFCNDPFFRPKRSTSGGRTPKHCGGLSCLQEFARQMANRRYDKEKSGFTR